MSVLKVYQDVMEDVISGVREVFAEDGVDEQVLQELKQVWETKLLATKAVTLEPKKDFINPNNFKQPIKHTVLGTQAPVQTLAQVIESKMVPIQITLPAQPGTDVGQRVLNIQVPASALQGNQLQKVLTGPIIQATMGLPQGLATTLLQQHVNAVLNQPQQTVTIGTINKPVIQTDGACDEPSTSNKSLKQIDGPQDTSDDEDDISGDDDISDEPDDDKEDDEQEMEDGGPEEEPLNSEDDVTDEDPTDLFDTENVVVCQYDKITRSRNKWKFHLKDGIMNLNGEDYLFQKASGDAEW